MRRRSARAPKSKQCGCCHLILSCLLLSPFALPSPAAWLLSLLLSSNRRSALLFIHLYWFEIRIFFIIDQSTIIILIALHRSIFEWQSDRTYHAASSIEIGAQMVQGETAPSTGRSEHPHLLRSSPRARFALLEHVVGAAAGAVAAVACSSSSSAVSLGLIRARCRWYRF